ncbi:methylenetetrahydrofolate--tRNA-(uracil(54)-C(5))-methyltransferase (FADH(2)-oxidizing) TrmFO [bacterium]|nr:methylenetetrahydrofolate--tRNA-(uracil(54)-C(5))-methyltransferase (FADH(2)-oxidizing) TrmFO [bacterium]
MTKVAIIGGGLAGCEAAWQLAKREIPVSLFEMRPHVKTPAHQTGSLAELVCSNSFKSVDIGNAHGLLKAEMEAADSLIIHAAKASAIPAGSALAVDRDLFSREIETSLNSLDKFNCIQQEITDFKDLQKEHSHVIIAGGPLLSDSLAQSLNRTLGEQGLFFYDAIAPIVLADSINMEIAYKASRYNKGEADYINCPMNETEYLEFVYDLVDSKKVPFRDFEQAKHFEGCLPIEVMAERGVSTLSFGPMKPVGLIDPRTGKQPWAVLQLRQENQNASLYNLVGCQTRMTWPEQKRVFRKIPGLENCDFARMGSMHRNTYINAPNHLNSKLELNKEKGVYIAGQLSGVEGYAESSAMGLWAAINIVADIRQKDPVQVNPQTMIGALVNYLLTASPQNFQPMNANFGLLPPPETKGKVKKRDRKRLQAELAFEKWKSQLHELEWN